VSEKTKILKMLKSKNKSHSNRAAELVICSHQKFPIDVIIDILIAKHDYGLGAKTIGVLKSRVGEVSVVDIQELMESKTRRLRHYGYELACVKSDQKLFNYGSLYTKDNEEGVRGYAINALKLIGGTLRD